MKRFLTTLGLLGFLFLLPAAAFSQPGKLRLMTPKGSLFMGLTGFKITSAFWRSPMMIQSLGLTADQQKRMDEIFHQYRIKIVDLNAALEKEELVLEPLMASGRPDADAEAKILTQIDRIANARAELEKGNSKMLLSILQVLTPEQWTRLPANTKKAGLFPLLKK